MGLPPRDLRPGSTGYDFDLPVRETANVISSCMERSMKGKLAIPGDQISEICRRYRIRKLALFGSVLRKDFGPKSDIDVLVEFEPESKAGLFALYDLERELSALFDGRRVDVNTPKSLSKYFRDQVLREAEALYEQT